MPKYTDNFNEDYGYLFPLGIGYISASLKKAKYNVDVLNLNHHSGKIVDIINRKLDQKKYDFVATGNFAVGYVLTATIINTAKAHNTRPKTILGGPIITTMPKLAFEDLGVDYGIIGEGEESVVELLDSIVKNISLRKVKGVIFKENNKTIITEKREPIANLDSLPFPDFDGLEFKKQLDHTYCNSMPYTTILDNPRMYPILASRSCPFQCTFCYHDSRYRQRSIENIMLEISTAIDKYDVNFLLIYDDCFAFDKSRLKKFCLKIKKIMKLKKKEIKWMCQLMVSVVDENLLKMLKDAGCVTISYGFESYSPIVLRSMKKAITPNQINSAFHATIKNGLNVQANFIFGDVAETNETSEETLNWWIKNANNQIFLTFVRPYPGSELYKHCLNQGIIKDELFFIKKQMNLAEVLNMTNKMTDEDITHLRKRLFILSGNSQRYRVPSKIEKVSSNTYNLCINCPYCKKKNDYKNCLIINTLNFDFQLICKHCYMRYYASSTLRRLLRKNYSLLFPLIEPYLNLVRDYKKKRIITK
ncbi:MAG: radical SAM protein [Pseudomonadota bacterium]